MFALWMSTMHFTNAASVLSACSCRTTGWACAQAPEGEKPDYCNGEAVALTTQERAWSSPIWYGPGK